jgi:hypothetical protein
MVAQLARLLVLWGLMVAFRRLVVSGLTVVRVLLGTAFLAVLAVALLAGVVILWLWAVMVCMAKRRVFFPLRMVAVLRLVVAEAVRPFLVVVVPLTLGINMAAVVVAALMIVVALMVLPVL